MAKRVAASEQLPFELRDRVAAVLLWRSAFETHGAVRRALAMERPPLVECNALLADSAQNVEEEDAPQAARREAEERRLAEEAWAEQQASLAREISSRVEALRSAEAAADDEPDAAKKGEALCKCLAEHRALRCAAKNIEDVGEKLNVIIEFIGELKEQLRQMDAKLGGLKQGVSALQADLDRLVGRPVLDEFAERRSRVVRQFEMLREGVYIPINGVRAGYDGKFTVNNAPRVLAQPDGDKINPS